MNDLPEFAEEYSVRERVRFVIVGVTVGAVVVAVGKLWLFPWLGQLANSAQCHMVLGVSGVTVLWYSLFAGLPLFGALVVACTSGHHGYKILRDGQAPPLREKVFRPTRIKRGTKAKLVGYLHLFAFSPLFALAIWGVLQAEELSSQTQHRPCTKTANPSIEGASSKGVMQGYAAQASPPTELIR
ncbi:MAG: hypothetical protein PSV24_11090 [Rhodoferax sp.]|nr:hypothetical protein [Rhodoferax sp.]